MCGIAGFLSPPGNRDSTALEGIGRHMAAALRHRGPDDEGVWVDPAVAAVMAHRRLTILDTSARGHQPMVSASGRYVLSYNGEIYNFPELRESMARHHRFASTGDTEVLLAAIERWGVRGALERVNGMFAFGVWDRETRTLHLSRDRLGEKPVYYGVVNGVLMFASELKGLRSHPSWKASVSREAVTAFLRFGYVPAPLSIYEGVRKLPAGTLVSVPGDAASWELPEPQPYWSLFDAVTRGTAARSRPRRREDVTDELETLLGDAVGIRMASDVPLGAFLSGGIDSSLVVALMQQRAPRPVRTFTIGFEDAAYDESTEAASVAHHLGTDHLCVPVSAQDALEVVPGLPEMYDEPFADASQVPTYLVSKVARQHVTVSLSGDGGDELFGGYNRYVLADRIWKSTGRWPRALRRAAGAAIGPIPATSWDRVLPPVLSMFPTGWQVRNPGTKIQKLAGLLSAGDLDQMYAHLISHWLRPPVLEESPRALHEDAPAGVGPLEAMMYRDAATYLPDDILVKVDRASMAVSLESRAPFLDHRVVEMAWGLPISAKIAGGSGKQPLRDLLRRYVPENLVDRPKMGFGLPLGRWLRGPLREWGEELLAPQRLHADGLLDVDTVRRAWTTHLSGRADLETPLWDVLMLQAWLAEQ